MSTTAPYEGRQIKGWPITVVSRGRIVVNNGKLMLHAVQDSFCPAPRPIPPSPRARRHPSFRRCARFGAKPCLMIERRLRAAHGALRSLSRTECYNAANRLTDEERHRGRGAFSARSTACVISCRPTRPG